MRPKLKILLTRLKVNTHRMPWNDLAGIDVSTIRHRVCVYMVVCYISQMSDRNSGHKSWIWETKISAKAEF